MYLVGTIDRDIYRDVAKDIMTNEVIITEERIAHIKEKHPNDYENFKYNLREIIEKPDYLIESNKINSAIVLKKIANADDKYFKVIIRLTTVHDNNNFKNSIITFMKIDKKEWDRLIRNKSILYKKEL